MVTTKKASSLLRLTRALNHKSFKGSKLLVAVVIAMVFAVSGGGIYGAKSFAAGPLYQYFWDSPGIQHNTGNAAIYFISYGGQALGNREVWEVNNFSNNGAYMWYGPKTTVNGQQKTHHVCWDYVSPSETDARVVFDITYNSGQNTIWSSGSLTIPNVPHIPGTDWVLHVYCHDFYLGAATFPNFEIRAKTIAVGSGEEDTFKLYKTIYQVL